MPHVKSLLARGTIFLSAELVTTTTKQVVGRAMGGQKPLGVARRFETPHLSLLLSGRLSGPDDTGMG